MAPSSSPRAPASLCPLTRACRETGYGPAWHSWAGGEGSLSNLSAPDLVAVPAAASPSKQQPEPWVRNRSLRRLLGGTPDPRGDELPGPVEQEVLTACTAALCFLLLGFVSSLYFSISMCAPLLCIPAITSNKFWPLYNTRHRSFSNGHLYPSLDFTARNWGGMMHHVAQGHPTSSLAVRGPLSKTVTSSYRIQPIPLLMLGHTLHLDFTSPWRCKPEQALVPLPPSQNASSSSSNLFLSSTISSLSIQHLQLESLVTTSLT